MRKFRFSWVTTESCPTQPTAAASPFSLTLSQWLCVLRGVAATAERANLALISAGVAFFGLMAVIPGIAAVVLGIPLAIRWRAGNVRPV